MRRSSKYLAAVLVLTCHGGLSAAERGPKTIIAEPYDQRPGTVTRPAGKADREWRRGRSAPEIVTAPQAAPALRPQRVEGPRYDGRGRRLNVPGRPDTYDQIGRSRALDRPSARIAPSGPTVRTDAATRINQFPPR